MTDILAAIPRAADPAPAYQTNASPGPSSPSPSSSSSTNSSPALKNKPVKKRQKKASMSGPAAGGAKGEVEGLHVCVTCGRTDSPEWRKGPLGPKTLCNVSLVCLWICWGFGHGAGREREQKLMYAPQACGLRWAKRNSTAPSRKEKKAMAEGKA